MKEQELTNEESLALIGRMISQAKSNYSKGGSFHFLMWGFVVAIANFGHYLIERYDLFDRPYLIWVITLPAIAISIIYSVRGDRSKGVKTHLDQLYGHVWLAAGVGIVITLLFMNQINHYHNAFILLFAMSGTYISGKMMRFTPLVIGSLALFVASIVCFNVSVVDQYLVNGIGIISGYIIPGYLLKTKENE